MKHGEGKLDYGNGDFYIGQWQQDKRYGTGIYVNNIEGVYEGNYVLDRKEGNGKMTFKTGDVYEGAWKKDKFHGYGILTCVSGSIQKYEGTFEQGKMSGKGTLYYRDGSRYDGHLQDDIVCLNTFRFGKLFSHSHSYTGLGHIQAPILFYLTESGKRGNATENLR